MNSKQTAVMWLGFLLVLARLFATDQWDSIWSTVTNRASTGSSGGGSGSCPAGYHNPCDSVKGPAKAYCHKACVKNSSSSSSFLNA